MVKDSASTELREAFAYCERLSRAHYENFPVASLFIPRAQRPYVSALYAFARTADDFADEGDCESSERLQKLDEWQKLLDSCSSGRASHPVFLALGETIAATGIPEQLLSDLLVAFRMDVTKSTYRNFEELLHYCRYSANPVGRIVLYIVGKFTPERAVLADRICTGLQLANFWQDLSVDIPRGRFYLPLDDLSRFGYTEVDLANSSKRSPFLALMNFQIARTRDLLVGGQPLTRETGGRVGFEIGLTIQGGLAILNAVQKSGYDILHRRPSLSMMHKAGILLSALGGRTS
jgi:squalene synthase HpnC